MNKQELLSLLIEEKIDAKESGDKALDKDERELSHYYAGKSQAYSVAIDYVRRLKE